MASVIRTHAQRIAENGPSRNQSDRIYGNLLGVENIETLDRARDTLVLARLQIPDRIAFRVGRALLEAGGSAACEPRRCGAYDKNMATVRKITPFLWFDGRAEEAAAFYTSIFRNSRILRKSSVPAGPANGNAIVTFEVDGLEVTALDGGPQFAFSPAISFAVQCESQDEVDYFWERLSEGGDKSVCGWLEDKFGVSWQVVSIEALGYLQDEARGPQVMQAMLEMEKPDIQRLRKVYESQG